MDIHVVQPGDTMYRMAQQYGVPMERLLQDNQLEQPAQLVVGQTIVVQYPALTHTVRTGDSLYSIAQMHNTTVAQLLRNNPALQGRDVLGCAQTGTGKTCAFATPILQRLSAHPAQGRPIRALILTPTRELDLQIQESFEHYGKNLPLRYAVIFGGWGSSPRWIS